jgi:hypothetical protein
MNSLTAISSGGSWFYRITDAHGNSDLQTVIYKI